MAAANSQQRSAPPTELKLPAHTAKLMAPTATSTAQPGRCILAATADAPTAVDGKEQLKAQLIRDRLKAKTMAYRGRGGRYSYRKDSKSNYHRGANYEQSTRYFGMDGNRKGPVGGRVTRVYEQDFNFQNSNNASTSAFFNFNFRQLAGVFSLAIYAGRPTAAAGGGTNLAELGRFPQEADVFCKTFKWMNVDAIEMQMMPVIRDQVQLTEGAPTQTADDAGILYFGAHDGDESIYAPLTGVSAIGFQEIQMLAHKNIAPTGQHSKIVAAIPMSTVLEENGLAPAADTVKFARFRPVRTIEYTAASADQNFPFSGLWLYWYHPNLASGSDGQRFFIRGKIRIQVSWNTVQDVVISPAPPLMPSVAGQPLPITFDGQPRGKYKSEEEEEPKLPLPQEDYVEVPPPTKPIIKSGLPASRPPSPARR